MPERMRIDSTLNAQRLTFNCERSRRSLLPGDSFYLVADVENAELRFANAGHPCALHIKQSSAPAEKLQGNGRTRPAIGIIPTASYSTSIRSMTKGDLNLHFSHVFLEVEDPFRN